MGEVAISGTKTREVTWRYRQTATPRLKPPRSEALPGPHLGLGLYRFYIRIYESFVKIKMFCYIHSIRAFGSFSLLNLNKVRFYRLAKKSNFPRVVCKCNTNLLRFNINSSPIILYFLTLQITRPLLFVVVSQPSCVRRVFFQR
jgi:hypothetical protein